MEEQLRETIFKLLEEHYQNPDAVWAPSVAYSSDKRQAGKWLLEHRYFTRLYSSRDDARINSRGRTYFEELKQEHEHPRRTQLKRRLRALVPSLELVTVAAMVVLAVVGIIGLVLAL